MKALASAVLTIVVFTCFFRDTANCQPLQESISKKSTPLPVVFQLGEYDKQYEETVPGYATLLDACNGDMRMAYDKLMGMMFEMEAYAKLMNYDLKGINLWIRFFWDKDGAIEHIGFYLKPNSRNANTSELKFFLENFARQYKFPLHAASRFSHYSSFAFPIVSQHKKPAGIDKSTARTNNPSNY